MVIHCTDTTALMADVHAGLPKYVVQNDKGVPQRLSWPKTPTVKNGTATLALVRVLVSERGAVNAMTSANILADVPMYGDYLAAMSSSNRAIYDTVYDQAKKQISDPQLGTITVTPPTMIGRFQ